MSQSWQHRQWQSGMIALAVAIASALEPLPAIAHRAIAAEGTAIAAPTQLAQQSPPTEESEPAPLAPSPWWLIVMPAIPLLGGSFTCIKRRLTAQRTRSMDAAPRGSGSLGDLWVVSYFPLLGLTAVSLVTFGVYVFQRSQLIAPVITDLEAVANDQESALDAWFDSQRQAVLDVASQPEDLPDIEELLTEGAGRSPATDPDLKDAYDAVKDYLENPEAFNSAEPSIALLTNGGIVVFSTTPAREGQYQPLQNTTTYFTQDRDTQVPNLYVSPLTDELQITFATPIFNEDNNRIGVIAVDLDLNDLAQHIEATPRQPQDSAWAESSSRSIYLVGRASLVKNQVISTDMDTWAEFSDGVDSLGIHAAVVERRDGAGLYLNPAKVPVIGVYRWAQRHNLALMVEVNQAEVLQPAQRTARRIFSIGMGIVVAGSLLSLWLRRNTQAADGDVTPSSDAVSPTSPEQQPGSCE